MVTSSDRLALIGRAVAKHDLVHILKFMWLGRSECRFACAVLPPAALWSLTVRPLKSSAKRRNAAKSQGPGLRTACPDLA